MYFALRNIKHNGNRYFRGDQLPEIAEAQLAALVQSGAVGEEKPEEPMPAENRDRVVEKDGKKPVQDAAAEPAQEPTPAAEPEKPTRRRRN
jgi:hypothetical protein